MVFIGIEGFVTESNPGMESLFLLYDMQLRHRIWCRRQIDFKYEKQTKRYEL